jgi:hypothetical protein
MRLVLSDDLVADDATVLVVKRGCVSYLWTIPAARLGAIMST